MHFHVHILLFCQLLLGIAVIFFLYLSFLGLPASRFLIIAVIAMHASSQHAQQTHEWRGGKMNTPFKQNICRCRYAFCCGNLCVSHSYKYIYTTINIEYHIIMWRRMCERQQLLGT